MGQNPRSSTHRTPIDLPKTPLSRIRRRSNLSSRLHRQPSRQHLGLLCLRITPSLRGNLWHALGICPSRIPRLAIHLPSNTPNTSIHSDNNSCPPDTSTGKNQLALEQKQHPLRQ